jgi:hypothetical protein
MGDIDLLCRPADSAAVSGIFREHGFLHGTLDKGRVELIPLSEEETREFEEGSIELAEFAKLVSVPALLPYRNVIDQHLSYWRMAPLHDTYYLVVGYDLHTHLGLEFDQTDVWRDLRQLDFPGAGPCLGQSYSDMAWYLAVRFYHELHINCAFVMRGFLDVLAILWRHREKIEWDRIVEIAKKYQLQPALYYTFWHVRELGADLVPERFLQQLVPSLSGSGRGHDWGDFMPKFLGEVQCYPLLPREGQASP